MAGFSMHSVREVSRPGVALVSKAHLLRYFLMKNIHTMGPGLRYKSNLSKVVLKYHGNCSAPSIS